MPLVIDDWLLLEYAVCTLPCNPASVTEAVSKSLGSVGPDALRKLLPPYLFAEVEKALPRSTAQPAFPFTALSEAERAIQGTIEAIDFQRLAQGRIDDALARHQGRV